ncbi:MAG: hypothetical protein CMK59_10410 [Proteobacteria bacterium]|nr:hypothetical protein [Pseudomonadota bacterium]
MILVKRETEDPRESILDKDVHVRAAATRDLSNIGDVDDIELLLNIAKEDSSLAVRHNAADAISDILSRHRIRDLLPHKKAKKIFTQFRKSVSPISNPAILMAYGALGIPEVLNILGIALREPRMEIRWGAALGIHRYCCSSATIGDQDLEEWVVGLLASGNYDTDAQSHLLKICSAASFRSGLKYFESIQPSEREELDSYFKQLSLGSVPNRGLWVSSGLDAVEINPLLKEPYQWCLIAGDVVWFAEEPKEQFKARIEQQKQALNTVEKIKPVEPTEEEVVGKNQPSPPKKIQSLPVTHFDISMKDLKWSVWKDYEALKKRRMWFRPHGYEQECTVLQLGDRTWHPVSEEDVQTLLQHEAKLPEGEKEDIWASFAEVFSVFQPLDNAKGWLSIALLWMRAHNWEAAIGAIENALEHKNPSVDLFYYLGVCRSALGDKTGAEEALRYCISKLKNQRSALMQICYAALEELQGK